MKAYRRFQILHSVKRPLYPKKSFTELGVCQLENIVTHKDRQGLMFYEYSIFIRYEFIRYEICMKSASTLILKILCSLIWKY